MQKGIKKFFGSDIVFLISTILAIGTMLFGSIVYLGHHYITYGVMQLLYVFCIIGIFISFKKHEKNAMKFTLGALMGIAVGGSLIDIIDSFSYNDPFWLTIIIIYGLSVMALCAFHVFLGLDHEPKPGMILAVEILVAVFFACSITLFIDEFIWQEPGWVVNGIVYLGTSFVLTCVVCVDTKIDTFKEIRSEKNNG